MKMRRVVAFEGEVFELVRHKEDITTRQAVRVGITDFSRREKVTVMDLDQLKGIPLFTKARIVIEFLDDVESKDGG